MFHLRDGFMFGRNDDGSVTIRVVNGGLSDATTTAEVTVPDNEWASVVASVCAAGETGASYKLALWFHNAREADPVAAAVAARGDTLPDDSERTS